MYYRHSNHPGGLKSISAGELKRTNPERLLETSMVPSTRLGEKQGKKLFVYGGAEHPHARKLRVTWLIRRRKLHWHKLNIKAQAVVKLSSTCTVADLLDKLKQSDMELHVLY